MDFKIRERKELELRVKIESVLFETKYWLGFLINAKFTIKYKKYLSKTCITYFRFNKKLQRGKKHIYIVTVVYFLLRYLNYLCKGFVVHFLNLFNKAIKKTIVLKVYLLS